MHIRAHSHSSMCVYLIIFHVLYFFLVRVLRSLVCWCPYHHINQKVSCKQKYTQNMHESTYYSNNQSINQLFSKHLTLKILKVSRGYFSNHLLLGFQLTKWKIKIFFFFCCCYCCCFSPRRNNKDHFCLIVAPFKYTVDQWYINILTGTIN